MTALLNLIRHAENELRYAKSHASPPGDPRRFLEFEAFAARTRLTALADAYEAVSGEKHPRPWTCAR